MVCGGICHFKTKYSPTELVRYAASWCRRKIAEKYLLTPLYSTKDLNPLQVIRAFSSNFLKSVNFQNLKIFYCWHFSFLVPLVHPPHSNGLAAIPSSWCNVTWLVIYCINTCHMYMQQKVQKIIYKAIFRHTGAFGLIDLYRNKCP